MNAVDTKQRQRRIIGYYQKTTADVTDFCSEVLSLILFLFAFRRLAFVFAF